MMKHILLVDDDFLALNAFFTLVDWNQYGLSIVHEAHNGQEAMDYLRDNRPDIVFIDVCMPDIDGITLLRHIRLMDPSILCIMLSSYSDYPYVREALKHGAADYLLKHEMTGDSILSLLKQYGIDTTPSMEKRDMETVLVKLFKEDRLECPNLSGLLALGYLSEGRPPIEVRLGSIHQTCRHILNTHQGSAVCSPCDNELVIFFPEHTQDEAQSLIAKIKKALNKYHHAAYTFLPLKHCSDSAQVDHTYQFFHNKYAQGGNTSKAAASSEETVALMMAVVNHQKALVERLVHSLYNNAKARNDLDGFGRDMLALFHHLKQLMGITGDAIPRLPSDAGAWEGFTARMLTDLVELDASVPLLPCSRTIREAINYLHQHYTQDISLNDVARHCNVSYNHLSFLFKKETGENIVAYVNQLRVYQAARMILFDSMPVSVISEKAGFKSYNHFYSTFRSITGKIPSEFKKDIQSIEWLLKFGQNMRMPPNFID